MFRFGALTAKNLKHALEIRRVLFLWLARGVSGAIAVVVDLPLATPALQNVFGTPETPVFYAHGAGKDRKISCASAFDRGAQ